MSYVLSPLSQRGLGKFSILCRRLEAAYIGNPKTGKAVKPHVFSNDRQQKELGADVQNIALKGTGFKRTFKFNQQTLPVSVCES